MNLNGLWPAVVVSYNGAARTARISIASLTEGSPVMPEAVFSNPLGDNAATTEIRIKAGDPVWVMFECGDPRYPIITGYRTPRAGNPTAWRRWAHDNIEITADGELIFNAKNVTWNVSGNETRNVGGTASVTAGKSTLNASTHAVTANTTIAGSLAAKGGASGSGVTMTGNLAISGGNLTHNGKNVGSTHTHTAQGESATTTPPN